MTAEYAIMPVPSSAVDLYIAPPNFADLWTKASESADEWMRQQWSMLAVAWLDTKEAKSKSQHTRRNYQRVLDAWLTYVADALGQADGRPMQPWLVEARHVRQWQDRLLERGLSETTVNHHLSCVSSFYSFVLNEKFMINGVEMCLFVDATNRPRTNPFKYGNVNRSRVESYERALPMDKEDLGKLIRYLEERQHSLSGARNFALVLTYVLTGWRNHETIRMQWGHIRPNKTQRGTMVYAWQGKGGKAKDEPIPADAWHAIVHYLKLDGRWVAGLEAMDQPIDPGAFIWRPVVEHTRGNLRNVATLPAEAQHLSDKSALRIVRTSLRKAGVRDWSKYRVHDLRHTFARLMLDDGATETEIMQRLHHSNLATTGLYTKVIKRKGEDPVDTRTARMYQQMRAG